MKNYFYSAETNGFYLLSLKSIYEKSTNGWPADAVPISDEVYQELLGGQSQGKFIVSDKNGNPMLTMPPEPTKEDKILMIKEKIKAHLACVTEKIGPLQDAVDLDIATELEIQKLMEWKTYRIKLNRLDIIDTSNIKFPRCPE